MYIYIIYILIMYIYNIIIQHLFPIDPAPFPIAPSHHRLFPQELQLALQPCAGQVLSIRGPRNLAPQNEGDAIEAVKIGRFCEMNTTKIIYSTYYSILNYSILIYIYIILNKFKVYITSDQNLKHAETKVKNI